MKHTPTISAEFEDYLKQNNMTLGQFAEYSGVHQRTLSNWITQHRPVSVQQLDRITLAMGLPEGYFYDLYIENYIIERSPNMRRIEPLLYRCAELDKLDAIRRMVGAIMDKLLYSPRLFDIAEGLFAQGQHAAALLLYESVAEGEKYQHSERLAVCQYRIFTIQIGDDQKRNLRAATRFESFVERLDEIVQLDALKDLGNVCRSLREWDMLDEIARSLENKAKIQYFKERPQKSTRLEQQKKPSRPLFAYLAFSQLLHASVCEAYGDYETALRYTYAYADLSWVKEIDGETQDWKKRFQEWAQANIYAYKLLSGEVTVLPDYLSYASSHKNEVLPALINIIEAANRYNINVDDILEQFELDIQSFLEQQKSVGVYTRQFVSERFTHFLKELADYYFRKTAYRNGFKYLINSLEISSAINNKSCIIKCVKLFERYRKEASSETTISYQILIDGVNEDEKKITNNRSGH
ncbi:helix-turn-helix domain-containing protein [Paenibacillus terrae]|uniref:Helix-turn-helix domain-containing protein n=1 Tax=Paenibacillus terrae (strain HPL-003) TaxID=985665 RepID=G7VSD0_PAETH|nr:helix-turn-helix transcriptional regulator [Paenibacillus terrae]AET62139.1 helix-turn-helix domain-containing protein [Paenibacillus terrae HPL-003]